MDKTQLLYTKSHEWAAIDGDTATIGISQYAVDQLTDVTHVEPKKVGTATKAGQPFGEIESVKAVFDLNAPLDGEIVEVNAKVKGNPSLINSDPYGEGWLIKIKLAPGASTAHLKSFADYEKQLGEEMH